LIYIKYNQISTFRDLFLKEASSITIRKCGIIDVIITKKNVLNVKKELEG
jgi:hypothetical protein